MFAAPTGATLGQAAKGCFPCEGRGWGLAEDDRDVGLGGGYRRLDGQGAEITAEVGVGLAAAKKRNGIPAGPFERDGGSNSTSNICHGSVQLRVGVGSADGVGLGVHEDHPIIGNNPTGLNGHPQVFGAALNGSGEGDGRSTPNAIARRDVNVDITEVGRGGNDGDNDPDNGQREAAKQR